MEKLIYLFVNLIILILLYINPSFALTPEEQARQQQLIIQQQQEQQRQQELNQKQIKETEKIRRTRVGIDGGAGADGALAQDIVGGDGCVVKFKIIKVQGNKLYSVKYLKNKVLGKYLGKCINKVNIQAIQNDLMKFYIDNGYTNARVYFDFNKVENFEDLKKGIFNIIIEEGKVRNIELIDVRYNNKLNDKIEKAKAKGKSDEKIAKIKESSFHKFRNNLQTLFAFPFLKDKEFNLRDYEQGLDQINRLQSNNATMEVKAVDSKDAKDAGYSDIVITNNNSFPISLNFGADNSGNKSTGERNAYAGVNIDNLLSVNDNIYLKYTQDLDWKNNKRYNKAFYSSMSIPFAYWTFSSSLNYSKYLTTVNGYATQFHTSGNTLTQTYNIDRVMFRRQLFKINTGAELTVRDTESWIRDLKSETGSRKSSNINFFLNNTIYTKLGTIILKPSYQKGLDWFNSKEDEDHSTMLKTEPRLQYDLVKLYAYYNTRVNLPLLTKTQIMDTKNQPAMQEVEKEIEEETIKKDENGNILLDKNNNPIKEKTTKKIKELKPIIVRNKINLNYTLTVDSQYSWNTLYGTDQFSAGGEYTVRGFRNSNISGDNGYYIRNDLRMNLQQLFPKVLLNRGYMSFGNKIKDKQYNLSINDALSRTYISLFYDYGYVEDKYTDSSDDQYNSGSGYMSGTGIALNYYGKYLNWSLTYAKALQSPNYLQTRDNIKKEEDSIYWRVGVRW